MATLAFRNVEPVQLHARLEVRPGATTPYRWCVDRPLRLDYLLVLTCTDAQSLRLVLDDSRLIVGARKAVPAKSFSIEAYRTKIVEALHLRPSAWKDDNIFDLYPGLEVVFAPFRINSRVEEGSSIQLEVSNESGRPTMFEAVIHGRTAAAAPMYGPKMLTRPLTKELAQDLPTDPAPPPSEPGTFSGSCRMCGATPGLPCFGMPKGQSHKERR